MRDAASKTCFKNDVLTRIKAFHEHELRSHADSSQKLKYFNVSMLGLSGRHHPSLSGIVTVSDVKKSRYHLKMLVGNLLTYEIKSEQSGGSPHCRLCTEMKNESISHILTYCSAYRDIRIRMFEEISYLCMQSKSEFNFTNLISDN
jgi:hypothetical protein